MSNANDVLMGGGATGATLTEGLTVAGRIAAISEPYQEREYDQQNPGAGKPKTWPSGDPIMTFNLDLATQERTSAEDDGIRRVYMDGGRIKKAVREAVKTSGAKGLDVGGWLSITVTHYDTPGDIRSGKNYSVQYVPGTAANNVLMGGQQQAPAPAPPVPQYAAPAAPQYAAPPTPQTPAPYYPPAPAAPQQAAPPQAYPPPPVQQAPATAPQPTPEQVAAVRAAGMDPATVFPGFTG